MSDYEIRFEPSPRRVRVEFNGTWIADSRRALILHETRQPPTYYFPREDVKLDHCARPSG
jgi:adenylate cyclase